MSNRVPSKLRQVFAGVLLAPACLNWSELESGRCGDSFVGREEACDDGNRISGDGCSDTCRVEPPACGNGRLEADERCDDGNETDGDACLNDCQLAVCGDGKLWEFEEACDDGNRTDGDGCSADCAIEPQDPGPRCGDATLDADEACDDGNTSNQDSCLNGCSFATCGDGYVRQGVEECDPGRSDAPCTRACLVCGDTPDSYLRAGNTHCYTWHSDAKTQEQARAACQAEGGDLWTITSEAEGADVAAKLTLTGELWLGLLTAAVNNSWVSGENPKYTSFAPGEPSDTALRCVAFDATTSSWSSRACGKKLGFVCERSPAFVFPVTHHGYRLHTTPVDGYAARAACIADGGYLAVLQTPDERVFVGKSLSIPSWVGADDKASNGEFVWSSGEPVETTSFAANQPDDADGSQSCLVLTPADRYADANCDERRAFICEFD